MGVKAQGVGEVSLYLNRCMRIVHEEVTRSLSYLGEQCVKNARDRAEEDSWYDHTGNLRSSIGYAVFEKGKKKIESDFPIVKQGGEGSEEGKRMVDSLAKLYSDTYALVVLAAMNYADYVEAHDSKDVLASTELMAQAKINMYLAKTKRRIERRIKTELK